ncbi:MAG: hypothetical protein WDM96_14580 [Lacunisphaera sp.]
MGVTSAAAPSAPVTAVAARSPVLDPAQLAQLRELPGRDGGTLLGDLIVMVLRDLPPEIERLGAAVDERGRQRGGATGAPPRRERGQPRRHQPAPDPAGLGIRRAQTGLAGGGPFPGPR